MFLGTIWLEIKLEKHLNDRIIVFEARKQCLYCVSQQLALTIWQTLFNNYSPKAKQILLNIYRDEVEVNIQQYLLSLRRIIVLV